VYVNFVNDRKQLGYECLKDTLCGNKLVLITDSSVIFVKHKSKRIVFVSIVVTTLLFSNVQLAEAIGINFAPQQIEHRIIVSDQNANKLMKPSKVKFNWNIKIN